MSKGLEALKKIKTSFSTNCLWAQESCNVIEKELKALEIIKKKVIVIPFLILHLSSNDLNDYNKAMDKKHKLIQEEYNLLKEVLL